MLRVDGAATVELAISVDGHHEGPLQGTCIAAAHDPTFIRLQAILNGCPLRALCAPTRARLAGQATLRRRTLDVGNVVDQRVLTITSMAALGKVYARMQRGLYEWTRQRNLFEGKICGLIEVLRFTGGGRPPSAIVAYRIPIAAMIVIQITLRSRSCM